MYKNNACEISQVSKGTGYGEHHELPAGVWGGAPEKFGSSVYLESSSNWNLDHSNCLEILESLLFHIEIIPDMRRVQALLLRGGRLN